MSLNPSEDQQYPLGMYRWGPTCRILQQRKPEAQGPVRAGPSHKPKPTCSQQTQPMLEPERLSGCQGLLGWVGAGATHGHSKSQKSAPLHSVHRATSLK